MTVEYTVIEKVPSAEAFCHLRVAAGMSPRPLEGARAGLPHSCYGVHILWQGDADRDGTYRRRRRD